MATGLIDIGGHAVGPGRPCLIIAEAGVNHNGSLERAMAMVDTAAAAGADVVKFQAFCTDQLVSPDAPRAEYQKRAGDGGQFEMLKALELGEEDFSRIKRRCDRVGVMFLATPFDEPSADMLCRLGVPAFKVSSGDLNNIPFLESLAGRSLPLILSTGMSRLEEVERAAAAVREAGDPGTILLHCVSAYPAEPAQVNLRAMLTLAEELGLPVGFSDHTLGVEIPLAAAALGACVIEKHFTLDRGLPGPDHQASAEPAELVALVRGVRRVEAALGNGVKEPHPEEAGVAEVARKSLVACRHIPAGCLISPAMLSARRPGTGLEPGRLPEIVGRRAARDIASGEMIRLEALS